MLAVQRSRYATSGVCAQSCAPALVYLFGLNRSTNDPSWKFFSMSQLGRSARSSLARLFPTLHTRCPALFHHCVSSKRAWKRREHQSCKLTARYGDHVYRGPFFHWHWTNTPHLQDFMSALRLLRHRYRKPSKSTHQGGMGPSAIKSGDISCMKHDLE